MKKWIQIRYNNHCLFLPNTPKEIVLFSVGDYDSSDTASLEVAYLNKDKDGYNYIEEIDDDKVLKEAMKVVKK